MSTLDDWRYQTRAWATWNKWTKQVLLLFFFWRVRRENPALQQVGKLYTASYHPEWAKLVLFWSCLELSSPSMWQSAISYTPKQESAICSTALINKQFMKCCFCPTQTHATWQQWGWQSFPTKLCWECEQFQDCHLPVNHIQLVASNWE